MRIDVPTAQHVLDMTQRCPLCAGQARRPRRLRRYTAALLVTRSPFAHHPRLALLAAIGLALAVPLSAAAQITAQARAGATPPWTKGILPISPESYYHAIDCGKQGGEDPPCVFYDTGLCKNDDFVLALYSPYKMVAHEVWRTVRQKRPAPTPNYAEAQRTRVTVGVTPARGSTNAFSDLILKRGGKAVPPVSRSLDRGGGSFTFDYPAFAATAAISLEMVGKTRTIRCAIPQPVLAQFR
jgi:hypothetical protein